MAGEGGSPERFREMQLILWVVLAVNLGLAAAKIGYGVLTGAVAMRADGVASLFDSVSNLVGIGGLMVAARPADVEHPYGHLKFETYASALIGGLLLVAAWNVGGDAVRGFMGAADPVRVDAGSFAVMLVTMCANLVMAAVERRRGRALRSELLVADSKDKLSDCLISVGVAVGLGFVAAGYPMADPIASAVVAVAILKSAFDVLAQANATLSDQARIPAEKIHDVVDAVAGVNDCHAIRTRGTEGEVYVDLHVLVDPDMSILVAHDVAERVEKALSSAFPNVVDVVVHVEPDTPEERYEPVMLAAEGVTADAPGRARGPPTGQAGGRRVMTGMRDVAVVAPPGDIDVSNVRDLRAQLERAIGSGARRLIVNCDAVRYVDSAGLAALVCAARETASRGGIFSITRASRDLMRILQIARLLGPLNASSAERPPVPVLDPSVAPLWCRTVRVDGGMEGLGAYRHRVSQMLSDVRMPAPDRFDVALAASEALGNALDHAEATGISMSVAAYPDRVVVEVCDNGRGYEIARDECPECSERRGRGIRLMRLLVDDVSVTRRRGEPGTRCRLVKMLRPRQ